MRSTVVAVPRAWPWPAAASRSAASAPTPVRAMTPACARATPRACRRVGRCRPGSAGPGARAAFAAGYAAGANDVFAGFDGGWSLSQPYVITLARGSGAVTYRIDSRRLARRRRSGDGRRAHGDGGEEVEQALGDGGVAGDLELGARGVEPEGLHPCALGPLDAGVRLGRAALLVADVAVLDVQDVHAGARTVGDPQLDRAAQPVGAARPGAQRRIAPTSIASPGRGGPQAQR